MAEETKEKAVNEQGVPMVTLTIDGQEVSVPKGTTVLEAAQSMGIHIPTFCWHPKLKSVGACRMCYVEIEKFPKLMVSCATEVMPDMIVHTASDQVLQGRKAVIEFILANHPLDCPTCDKGGECDLQNLTFAHGIDDSRFDFSKNRFVDDGMTTTFDDLRIGPEIMLNRNRCILCYRCVRANKEAFGEYDLGVYERGNIAEINSAPGRQVSNPFSGNLVQICPVGALTNSDWRYKIRVWLTQTAASVCPYTSSGSNISFFYERHQNKIFRVTARGNDEIDDGWIADVTRYGYQIIGAEDRLKQPLIKKGGKQQQASWDEALGMIYKRFSEIKEKKGSVCLAGLASPGLDNTSLHAFNKLMRSVLQSNNVDFRTDYRFLPEGGDSAFSDLCRRPFKIADIDDSDVLVSFGSDLVREHPNEYLRIRKARNFGRPAIFSLNPYAVKSADIADYELVYRPGCDELAINAICLAAIEDGKVDASKGAALKDKLKPKTSAEAAKAAGVSLDDVKALVNALADGKKITFIVGELVARSSARETIGQALCNLDLLFGLAERGQMAALAMYANSVGAEKLGVTPYPSTAVQSKLTELWGAFPESEPHNTDAAMALMRKEEISGLFVVGSDPAMLYPDREFVAEALGKLDFLVVADMFESETTELADVVLPLAGWAEYRGDYINLEGRLQTGQGAVKAPGEARPAWQVMTDIAAEFDAGWSDAPDELNAEVASLLATESAESRSADFTEVEPRTEEVPDDYPLPLFVCDDPHHRGHLTEKAASLTNFVGEAYVEMSPELAAEHGISEGDSVRVESPRGKVIAPAKISEWLDTPVVLLPRNFASTPVMSLIDRKVRVDRVRISKVEP